MSDFPESVVMKKNVADVMSRGMELVDLFVNKNYLIDIDRCEPISLASCEKYFRQCPYFK